MLQIDSRQHLCILKCIVTNLSNAPRQLYCFKRTMGGKSIISNRSNSILYNGFGYFFFILIPWCGCHSSIICYFTSTTNSQHTCIRGKMPCCIIPALTIIRIWDIFCLPAILIQDIYFPFPRVTQAFPLRSSSTKMDFLTGYIGVVNTRQCIRQAYRLQLVCLHKSTCANFFQFAIVRNCN